MLEWFKHWIILRKTQFCIAKKEPVKLIKCVTIEISFFHAISQAHMSPWQAQMLNMFIRNNSSCTFGLIALEFSLLTYLFVAWWVNSTQYYRRSQPLISNQCTVMKQLFIKILLLRSQKAKRHYDQLRYRMDSSKVSGHINMHHKNMGDISRKLVCKLTESRFP